MQILPRVLGTLVLLAVVGFCVFGFMASYEYPEAARRLPWQIGYAVIGLACLSAIVLLLRPRRQKSARGTTDASR